MHIGLIGLGKMGGNMRTRLRRAGHEVTGFDFNPDIADAAATAKRFMRSSTGSMATATITPG